MTNKKLIGVGIGLFAAGAGVGAAVGLLYAPRAGRHTRAKILNTANGALNRLDEIKDEGKEVLDKVRERIDEGRERVGEYFRSVAG